MSSRGRRGRSGDYLRQQVNAARRAFGVNQANKDPYIHRKGVFRSFKELQIAKECRELEKHAYPSAKDNLVLVDYESTPQGKPLEESCPTAEVDVKTPDQIRKEIHDIPGTQNNHQLDADNRRPYSAKDLIKWGKIQVEFKPIQGNLNYHEFMIDPAFVHQLQGIGMLGTIQEQLRDAMVRTGGNDAVLVREVRDLDDRIVRCSFRLEKVEMRYFRHEDHYGYRTPGALHEIELRALMQMSDVMRHDPPQPGEKVEVQVRDMRVLARLTQIEPRGDNMFLAMRIIGPDKDECPPEPMEGHYRPSPEIKHRNARCEIRESWKNKDGGYDSTLEQVFAVISSLCESNAAHLDDDAPYEMGTVHPLELMEMLAGAAELTIDDQPTFCEQLLIPLLMFAVKKGWKASDILNWTASKLNTNYGPCLGMDIQEEENNGTDDLQAGEAD